MSPSIYEVLVAKEYEIQQDGHSLRRTAWNRVGSAWHSHSQESLCFELFLIPNQRYVIQLRKKMHPETSEVSDFVNFKKL